MNDLPHRHATTAVIVAAVLALAVGPTLGRWSNAFLGDGGVDAWGTQWFYWFLGLRVLDHAPFAHTDLMFYPWGKDIYLHTGGNVVDAALALPFRYLLGPTVGYNAFCVATLLANGVAATTLARSAGVGRAGAWTAGALFVGCPYALFELAGGRPAQAILAFVCLFFASWLKVLDGGRPREVLAAAAWLALAGLTYWFQAIFAAMAAAGTLLVHRPGTHTSRARTRLLGRAAAVAGLSIVLVAPVAWPMVTALAHGRVPGLLDTSNWTLASWAPVTTEGYKVGIETFDALTGRAGFHVETGRGGLSFLNAHPVALWTQLALGLVGLAFLGRWRRAVLAMATVGLVLAVGPVLEVRSELANPVYLLLVRALPPLRRMWWPVRAIGLVQVALVPAMAAALDRATGPRSWRLVPLVAAAAWAGELARTGLVPLPAASADVPKVYRCLAGLRGAILELPYGGAPERLHYQAISHRPRFGGMLEDNPIFVPEPQARFRSQNSFVADLVAIAAGRQPASSPTPQDRQALHDLGYTYVVVDGNAIARQTAGPGAIGARRRALMRLRALLGHPVFVDGGWRVYAPWGDPWSCASDPVPAEGKGGR